ncbi:MAG: tetratricopeptide repeat protein [Deltaproteobacteria bacterium]|nr:tetratricopeptide repeat protein [Deltaproteobacteria bacterium]
MTSSNCNHWREAWDEYRASDTTIEDKERFEAHLAECPECREFIETLEGIQVAINSSKMDPLLRRRLTVAIAAEEQAPKHRIPLRLAFGVSALAAAAVAVFILVSSEPPSPAPSPKTAWAPAPSARSEAPETSPDRAEIETTKDGRRFIEVFSGTALWLDGKPELEAELDNENLARFVLSKGRVVAEVGAHKPGFRFIVTTPAGEVEARGTLFSVEVEPDGTVETRVAEGTIEVRPNDGDAPRRVLTAGQEIVLGDDSPSLASTDDLQRDRCLALLECDYPKENDARRVSKETRPHTRPSPKKSNADARPQRAAVAIEESRFVEAADLVEQVFAERPRAVVTRDLLAKLARAYRRAKLFGPAADTYRRLINTFPGSEAATNGLVSLAQIELDTLGQSDSALSHFETYLNRSPSGYLREAARAGRVRALEKLGRMNKIPRAVSRYLAAHPNGLFVAEMLCRRGDAETRLGNCASAVKDYHRVLTTWPGSREAKKAARGLGACGETPQ